MHRETKELFRNHLWSEHQRVVGLKSCTVSHIVILVALPLNARGGFDYYEVQDDGFFTTRTTESRIEPELTLKGFTETSINAAL